MSSEEDTQQNRVALLGWLKVRWLPAYRTTETNQLL